MHATIETVRPHLFTFPMDAHGNCGVCGRSPIDPIHVSVDIPKENPMDVGIEIRDRPIVPPTPEEARDRFVRITSEPYDPPLTDAEVKHIEAVCLSGGTIFLRCKFEPASRS
jgi:hypothetical protein